MSEFAGKLHYSALSWDLCVISNISLMVPGPSFRQHCTAFNFHIYMKTDPLSVAACLTSHSLETSEVRSVGARYGPSGLGSCCIGIPTLRMLTCSFVES